MDYIKQPLDYEQIIQQLKSRGLLFHDIAAAEKELKIAANPNISLHAMGFPSDWQEQPLWK